ncbi:MAG: sigma-70 family RNA polymerase sigma factor [Nanoarchaeota archaeon]|nr:sigma-70 family RNA polymerase sigma factor [Nanoarchaeota archaeon]
MTTEEQFQKLISDYYLGDDASLFSLVPLVINQAKEFSRFYSSLAHLSSDVEDVAMLATVKIVEAVEMKRYQPTGYFRGYIRKIIRNESINFSQKMNKRLKHLDTVLDAEELPRSLHSQDFLNTIICKELADECIAIGNALPEKYVEPFNLCYQGQMSMSEISQETGTPEGTIKRLLHHARKMIRTEMYNRLELTSEGIFER